MTPTDASERERLAELERRVMDGDSAAASEVLTMVNAKLRADAEKIRALEAVRDAAQELVDDLTFDNARGAQRFPKLQAALAATQSPRSEAGEES